MRNGFKKTIFWIQDRYTYALSICDSIHKKHRVELVKTKADSDKIWHKFPPLAEESLKYWMIVRVYV